MTKKDTAIHQEHAVKVLERVWTLSKRRKAAKSKRENLFTERDSIDAEIAELKDDTSHEAEQLAGRWRRCVKEIEKLKIDIGFYGDEIDRAIEEGEQGKFDFLEDPMKPPAELYDKLTPKKAEEQMTLPADGRPVGRPDRKNPDPIIPDGVDQHLAAAVSELDLPEQQKGKLIKGNLPTIAHLVEFIDAAPNTAATRLEQRLDCNTKVASSIIGAVEKYRKVHRRAMVEAERGE